MHRQKREGLEGDNIFEGPFSQFVLLLKLYYIVIWKLKPGERKIFKVV